MDWVEILKVIGMIILGMVVICLLFYSFILSRLMSLGCCGLAIYLIATATAMDAVFWPVTLLAVFGWLFYRGENTLETYETGWIIIDWWGFSTPEIAGGFISHFVPALIVIGLLFHFVAPGYPFVYYAVPGLIVVLDIISFFTGI